MQLSRKKTVIRDITGNCVDIKVSKTFDNDSVTNSNIEVTIYKAESEKCDKKHIVSSFSLTSNRSSNSLLEELIEAFIAAKIELTEEN